MQRTILSVAYPLTEVGPDAVGGSEQILTVLDRTLTEAGHRSLVIAAKGSQLRGVLIPSDPVPPLLDEAARAQGRRRHRELIRETLRRFKVDLIHLHSLDFHHYLPETGVPLLATLHLPPDWYPGTIFERSNLHLNCVSPSQSVRCPPCDFLWPPIPNGVDVEGLQAPATKGGFALAMGRICPEKGFHFALDAARQAGTPLLLAGQLLPYREHVEYFDKELRPRLDESRRFVGPLRFFQKRRLLSQARCLIVPSVVAETSSLVTMEALACGTPVIAFRTGALPDLIEDGRTGFIVSNQREMATALREVGNLSPELCRKTARARFSSCEMSAKYLELYERLIQKHPEPKRFSDASQECLVNT